MSSSRPTRAHSYTEMSSGPKTEPCGSPVVQTLVCDMALFVCLHWEQPNRYDFIKSIHLFSLVYSDFITESGTLSKPVSPPLSCWFVWFSAQGTSQPRDGTQKWMEHSSQQISDSPSDINCTSAEHTAKTEKYKKLMMEVTEWQTGWKRVCVWVLTPGCVCVFVLTHTHKHKTQLIIHTEGLLDSGLSRSQGQTSRYDITAGLYLWRHKLMTSHHEAEVCWNTFPASSTEWSCVVIFLHNEG